MARFHPASILLGLALAGLCFLTMSQSLVATNSFRIDYNPHPRDMIQISEGTPYVVPVGRILVITGLGWVGSPMASAMETSLKVNGQTAVTTANYMFGGAPFLANSILPLPTCLSLPAGSIVEPTGGVQGQTDDARAWGYLSGL